MTQPHNSITNRPVLVFVRGLPGSGKSYLTKAVQAAFGNEMIVLDPDAIDYESDAYKQHVQQQIAEGVDAKLHAYRFLRAKAYDGITNCKVIIWNQPFSNLEIFKKMIGRMHDHAAEAHVSLSILIIELELDPEIARQRVVERKKSGGHGPSDTMFNRYISDHTTYADLGFKTVTVDGAGNITDSVEKVLDAIEALRAS